MTRKRQPPKKPTKAVDAPPSEPPEADVDATVISVARLHGAGDLPVATTLLAVGLTAAANMATKASIAWKIGGAAVGWPVLLGYAVATAVGTLAVGWSILG